MKGASISDGDSLVIDKDGKLQNGCIAVFELNGQKTVKRYEDSGEFIKLIAENPDFPIITIYKNEPLQTFGVVLYIIKTM